MKDWLKAGFAVFILLAGLYFLSWTGTCAIIWLVTMCFGWTFSWKIATGVWLLLCIAKKIFSHNTTVNK